MSDSPRKLREMSTTEIGELMRSFNEDGAEIEVWDGVIWKKVPWSGPGWYWSAAYRVKPEPVRETATLYGYVQVPGNGIQFDNLWKPDRDNTIEITFDLVDGEPDVSSIKMKKMDD